MTMDWIIGFIWGNGSIVNRSLRLRYHDEKLLDLIVRYLQLQNTPYRSSKGTFILHIPGSHEITQTALRLGYWGKRNPSRQYPWGNIDQLEFIRGYCYTKAHVRTKMYKSRKGKIYFTPLLVIYGKEEIVKEIDSFFVSSLSTSYKKTYRNISHTSGREYYAVFYSSTREVPDIVGLIDTNLFPGDPEREYPLHRMLANVGNKS